MSSENLKYFLLPGELYQICLDAPCLFFEDPYARTGSYPVPAREIFLVLKHVPDTDQIITEVLYNGQLAYLRGGQGPSIYTHIACGQVD